MTFEQRKAHLTEIGKFLSQFSLQGIRKKADVKNNDPYFDRMQEEIGNAVHYNGWFTRENVLFSLQEWGKALTAENLDTWLEDHKDPIGKNSVTVGIIMAGNIPLVGFHDFISVLVTGHKVLAKQSSNDKRLLPVIADYLVSLEPEYKDRIRFTEGRMEKFDAVIATGSNNTARYFEYYFADKPSIIRKNRNSVAILTGEETPEELEMLGEDIFRYSGLGCRNVSKLYVPAGYSFDKFFEAMFPWSGLINHAKYANNYDYNKAVYLMSEFRLLDNGFLILKEDQSFSSPIATLFYEYYDDEESLRTRIAENRENLQCIVSKTMFPKEPGFGETQHPRLWDYADKVNTLDFLSRL